MDETQENESGGVGNTYPKIQLFANDIPTKSQSQSTLQSGDINSNHETTIKETQEPNSKSRISVIANTPLTTSHYDMPSGYVYYSAKLYFRMNY